MNEGNNTFSVASEKKSKDKTFNFFNNVLSKYLVEIESFDKNITVNDEDTFLITSAKTIVNTPEGHSADTLAKAAGLYDSVVFYESIKLLLSDNEKNKYEIDPNVLAKKALEGGLVKANDSDVKLEVVSVYKKGSKK